MAKSQNNPKENHSDSDAESTADPTQALLELLSNVGEVDVKIGDESNYAMASIDKDEFTGEFSKLSKDIDEIDSYMDKWEDRHKKLQAAIAEALNEINSESTQNFIKGYIELEENLKKL